MFSKNFKKDYLSKNIKNKKHIWTKLKTSKKFFIKRNYFGKKLKTNLKL